ncbi:MAG: copper amine oxidase N-terminal domain-containing protein [Symbiobacteriaceae bacterium]|nr:copper amine oxidase N-terminal domain-containing protein [Symbiobacteriaceae bacterium]
MHRPNRWYILSLWLLIFILWGSSITAQATATSPEVVGRRVEAELANISMYINGGEVAVARSRYPLLLYNDITYLPLTWYLGQALGLEVSYDYANNILKVRPDNLIPLLSLRQELLAPEQPSLQLGSKVQATTVAYTVYIGEEEVTSSATWPLLSYQYITYLPLTWHYAYELLNINYQFSSFPQSKLTLSRSPGSAGVQQAQLERILNSARTKLLSEPFTSTVQTFRSGRLIAEEVKLFDPTLQTNNPAYPSLLPQIPALDLRTPPGGWQVSFANGDWFLTLDHLTVELDNSSAGSAWLYTFTFNMDDWSLFSLEAREVSLRQGELAPNANDTTIMTWIAYTPNTPLSLP